ncbi:hypothetical protein H5410_041815 [Solanum commersonii]|uniref:Uncharacterized protein n=1 Tax=Solanum commersonii TaxID=4109 RepID=A0A9J5XTY0_SOLCO|nr:hypothetical protein H5410_041815 [Solanum commersonii]
MSLEGLLLSSHRQVKEEITKFYTQLLGTAATSLPAVDITIMGDGNTLTRDQQLQLVRKVDKEEIWKALAGINDMKSHGYDGFNACFFKKECDISIILSFSLVDLESSKSGKFVRAMLGQHGTSAPTVEGLAQRVNNSSGLAV